ncbi:MULTISPECIES: glutathionylspermidine synthase family protein [unclassified Campylobacter]|uniref:glutathionylspermidine synthase family protein n=1 Tax=unclassified Campylobacter TaxID=2593542 RepID=UPI0012382886|nr:MULTISPECIES: glutathionylspermidine synthase family protein [unclassified Campylobacter]KAA6227502.1 glutathionylspermidine synthase family protein [Campylobacter sp. LR196d]KAA6228146.1 glutathionylspermidine synthase family protein [Campylobacter sp. LR185c]KAA6228528.1 glutathionylspermidine synthase family protein [Campylobacter sp. LR286c]KAA6230919.1 glutathionylspermidine synthase family protein [Campylobacter sp. LR291e]KAA6233553.1 glutathionylspermidine synthase family protein [C
MKFLELEKLQKDYLENMGFSWHTDTDGSDYIDNNLVCVSHKEANAYYEAANELYDMFVNAAQNVIDNNRFSELNIPFNLIDAIKMSWENDVHWHLYGRFDFAGGLDNEPIKLIEFNADTPTSLFESAILQWAILKQNNLDESAQFNNIYEALMDNFKRLISLEENVENFEELYRGWKILFSSIAGNKEEELTTKLLQHIAIESGFKTSFAYVDEVDFSENGIFKNNENFEYWFKLIPWEDIAIEEGELAMLLTQIMRNQKAIILNPAYTLLFQSKGIMKILWELYPNHPLLLETSFEPLQGDYVKKPFFGREGANISIVKNKKIVHENIGPYGNNPCIYQALATFNTHKDNFYQAGVFFAFEGCGLGFRKGGTIIDNVSKFVGHIIKEN